MVQQNWWGYADVAHHSRCLDGVRVLVTRTPERARDFADAVVADGGSVVFAPMRQAAALEDPRHQQLIEQLNYVAAAAAPDWLAVTSVNTVLALCQALSMEAVGDSSSPMASLGDWVRPAVARGLRVAAVGAATAHALEHAGVRVDLVPPAQDSSAQGLVQVWPQPPQHVCSEATVYLPQSEIARSTLRDGLVRRGWAVHTVTAYRMVPWPAALPLSSPTAPAGERLWSPEEARRHVASGAVDVVVATAPSLLRELLPTPNPAERLNNIAFVAMGEATRRTAEALGVTAYAAVTPNTDGLLQAVKTAVKEHRA